MSFWFIFSVLMIFMAVFFAIKFDTEAIKRAELQIKVTQLEEALSQELLRNGPKTASGEMYRDATVGDVIELFKAAVSKQEPGMFMHTTVSYKTKDPNHSNNLPK